MKKFLSLVLALVMTMSLVTVSAGAKDFTDADDITYAEAIDVMSAVGVVSGYADGDFRPEANLTRGAAAKIICNMILGPTTASALRADSATFKDVPTDHTFAGYIAFCAQQGIINGYADGTFRPAAPLTGYAFMKMLLGALGYDAKVEGYVGANWSVQVAKRALNIGLNDGLVDTFNGVKTVTREEACLYAFNTLKADMVAYDSKTTVSVGGAEVVIAGSKAEPVANTARVESIYPDDVMQFAEKYFTDLKLVEGDTDAFERPATTWKLKSKAIGTYANTPDLTYTADVKMGTIYADLGLTDGIYHGDVAYYVDGAKVTWTNDIVKGSRLNQADTGNGVLTEVYYDADANEAVIVSVNTYVAAVDAVRPATTTQDAYVKLFIGGGFTSPTGFKNDYVTDEFEKDDIVRYTYSKKDGEDCIQSMELAEKVTGTMNRYTLNGDVTLDSEKYSPNEKSVANIIEYVVSVDKNTEVAVYLDAYGYDLYVDADVAVDYAVILDYNATAGDFNRTKKAELLFTDGTTKIVEVDAATVAHEPFGNRADNVLSQYDIVSYSVDSDDVYTLTVVADSHTSKAGDSFKLENGDNKFSVVANNLANLGNTKSTTFADGKTIFLVDDDGAYSAYEGIANVPTIKHNGGAESVATVFAKDGAGQTATVVFVKLNERMTMSSDNQDVIFVKGSTVSHSYTADLGYFYEYDAYINGDPTTIKVSEAQRMTEYTLVYGPHYNAKGILVGAQNGVDASDADHVDGDLYYAVGTDSVINDVIKLGGFSGTTKVPYAYDKNVEVYFIDVEGDLSEGTIGSIGYDEDDQVFFKVNDKGRLTEVYVRIVDEADAITPPTETDAVAVAGRDNGSGALEVNLQNSNALSTKDVTGTVTVSVLTDNGVWVKLTDVVVTIPTGTAANGWGTAQVITGLAGGQYKLTCADLSPVFVTMA